MNIVIEGLNVNSKRELVNQCGRRIFTVVNNEHDGVCDAALNECAVMKVYDDCIFFDLGGQLGRLKMTDYFTITIS